MITKVYPDSGLKAKDFKVGDQVVIQDPLGDAEAFEQGKFKLGDICTVTNIGENVLYFTVNHNGYKTRLYCYRMAKSSGFRIKDIVKAKDDEGSIVSFEGQHCLVSCGRDLKSFNQSELTLVGRRKLI